MHRLEDKYAGQVDFLYLDIEDEGTLEARQRFDIVARTQYVLIDAQGNVIYKWFGYIDEADIDAKISEFLTSSA